VATFFLEQRVVNLIEAPNEVARPSEEDLLRRLGGDIRKPVCPTPSRRIHFDDCLFLRIDQVILSAAGGFVKRSFHKGVYGTGRPFVQSSQTALPLALGSVKQNEGWTPLSISLSY
jgi:hypothetical protein